MTKVSVIVPVYNVEKYLEECLDSIINQTLEDIEIICVDDKSADNSLNILKRYKEKDTRIKIIEHNANKGLGSTRNTALDVARGEYIMFVDSDDWLEPEACEEAYSKIKSSNCDFVCFNSTKVYMDKRKKVLYMSSLYKVATNVNKQIINLNELKVPFFNSCEVWNKIYDRKFIENNHLRFTNEKIFAEDVLFFIQIVLSNGTFTLLNKSLYNYRMHDNNSVHKPLYDDLIRVHRRNFEQIKNSDNSEDLLARYIASCIKSLLFWYKQWPKENPSIKPDFYNKMRNLFIEFSSYIDEESIKYYVDLNMVKKIINNDYKRFVISNFLERIFSLRDVYSVGFKRKILYILGIKIRLSKTKC